MVSKLHTVATSIIRTPWRRTVFEQTKLLRVFSSIIRTPLFYRQFCLQWLPNVTHSLPLQHEDLDWDGQFLNTPNFLQFLPLSYGHLYHGRWWVFPSHQTSCIPYRYNTDTLKVDSPRVGSKNTQRLTGPTTIMTPLYYRQFSVCPVITKLHTFSSSIITLEDGQFSWSQRHQTYYSSYLYNTDTSLLLTVLLLPKITNFLHLAYLHNKDNLKVNWLGMSLPFLERWRSREAWLNSILASTTIRL